MSSRKQSGDGDMTDVPQTGQPAGATTIKRFTLAERRLHWTTALSVGFLVLTGALIWRHLDEWEVAGINVISRGHVWLGGLMLVAGMVGFVLWRRRRIPHADKRFSSGQRLGLRLVQGLLLVMIVSGTVLYLREFVTMSKGFRTLVRQIHFWSAVPVVAFIAVHLERVLIHARHRGLLQGMLSGRVSRAVAERVSPDWVASLDDRPGRPEAEPAAGTAG